MNKYNKAAETLTQGLQLSQAPVAIAFCNEMPEGVSAFDEVVAAGCQFWELAAQKVFATSAKDHQLCSIGIHTHNLAGAPETQNEELTTTLTAMMGLDYVRAEEIALIPVIQTPSHYVVYGPLHAFPVAAEVLVIFADAQQSLVISEAVERVDGATPLAMGRPACGMVPQVVNKGAAALSLGCCGARAYLDALTSNTSLWALPVSKLDQYAAQIQTLSAANNALSAFHQQRKKDVMAGETPTVAISLQRM